MQEHVCAPTRLASSMMFEQSKGVRAKASEHMTVVDNLAIACEHATFICAFIFTQALKHKHLKLSMVIELTIFPQVESTKASLSNTHTRTNAHTRAHTHTHTRTYTRTDINEPDNRSWVSYNDRHTRQTDLPDRPDTHTDGH